MVMVGAAAVLNRMPAATCTAHYWHTFVHAQGCVGAQRNNQGQAQHPNSPYTVTPEPRPDASIQCS